MFSTLIDPKKITNFNADKNELELMIFFWVLAAGKNGIVAAKCLSNMLNSWKEDIDRCFPYPGNENLSPFDIIRYIINEEYDLAKEMKKFGIGCYNNKARSFKTLAYSGLNLFTCSVEDLEAIYSIGPKTARCFLIHSRPNQNYAGLDRHILAYMRDKGYSVPKSTPSGEKYKKIEREFIKIANNSGRSIAQLDLEIWNQYRNKK